MTDSWWVGDLNALAERNYCPMMALEREGSQKKPGGQRKTVEREREIKQRLGIGSLGTMRS